MSAESCSSADRSLADEAFAITADARACVSEPWERSVPVGIERLFAFLAEHGDRAEACIAADGQATRTTLAHRDRAIQRFSELLEPGYEIASPAPPPVVAEAIASAIYELIRGYAIEDRLQDLPGATTAASILVLAPFVGMKRASDITHATDTRAPT